MAIKVVSIAGTPVEGPSPAAEPVELPLIDPTDEMYELLLKGAL